MFLQILWMGNRKGLDRMARWKFRNNLGMLLLSIWLIITGLITLAGFSFPGLPVIMGILAIAAGILLLLNR